MMFKIWLKCLRVVNNWIYDCVILLYPVQPRGGAGLRVGPIDFVPRVEARYDQETSSNSVQTSYSRFFRFSFKCWLWAPLPSFVSPTGERTKISADRIGGRLPVRGGDYSCIKWARCLTEPPENERNASKVSNHKILDPSVLCFLSLFPPSSRYV